ncbi:dienelactone hydrolase family protein [Caulobacter sp. NIBR2454]|uniref:dienelactone hydrolase family protein n=1 Tax=Caulobacter sp. NIBR2454 TaxID=3015996 RepID=UPI0022B6669F|nr:dienelactone hydrolase family protein [Caulobacter sp. NIBR2454]
MAGEFDDAAGYDSGDLDDFEHFVFDDGRWSRDVYRKGSGPAVIVIHEIPGLHPLVIRFAEDLVAAGMTVFCPSLMGQPGRPVTPNYARGVILKTLCVRREFTVWATDRSSPIVDWLRALARKAHAECGGPGVGSVGMCFTGGFALAMMTEPSVIAPVLSQPSLPLGKKGAASLGCSKDEIACARQRFEAEDLSLLGLRFRDDPFVPAARFDAYRKAFGDRFEAIELDPASARPGTGRTPHSVLSAHLDRSDPEGPTMQARDRVVEFFRQRLRVDTSAPRA